MCSKFAAINVMIAAALTVSSGLVEAMPAYTIEEAVLQAQQHNPEILIAQKKVIAARGGFIEARSGYLPSLSSSGLYDKRQTQSETNLRQEDYNAIVKLEQNIYTGGAVGSQVAIAQLNITKANYDLQETISRVTMDVRIAFNELLLNRAKVRVHEDSVRVFEQELKGEQENFNAGIVGKLNVQRAEVALANERPEFFSAQTDLKNSYLRLAELFGTDIPPGSQAPLFEISGELQYRPNHPDLNDCLARADANRGILKSREKDIQIEDQQYILDRSATRPHVRAFSGYEIYSERDPDVGPEFNYGGVVGINATWNIFDGHATKGRMQATRARRDAAVQALAAARRSVGSEVRSAFFDLQQADRVLESETKNVQTADQALDMARGNFAAGLGTQLDVLQAAADVTRTRTTRLSAIYLHNVALAHLGHACASSAEALNFGSDFKDVKNENPNAAHAADVARPPQKMSQR
ncbi:MAG TPA: TolC family protein [Candidatus Udaeobacter sp.]|jgi:outer membrane protein TolC|nr:TolC family protein [Candidatus Udaeobacter sp.]